MSGRAAVEFTIPGPPLAKERPRRAPAGHWYTPTRTVRAEEQIGMAALAAGLRLKPETPYAVEVDFYISTLGRDLDNLQKTILDGLGRMGEPDGWNDRQVVKLTARIITVRDGADEKTVVRVTEGER